MSLVALTIITDGRKPETISHAIESLRENLIGAVGCFIIDDSANPDYGAWLDSEFADYYRITHHTERRGLGGAVYSAWSEALKTPAKYVLHWEDDFVATTTVSLSDMTAIFNNNDQLAQLSLKRQPVNPDEQSVGGYMQMSPSQWFNSDRGYVRHSSLFTYNPCLIPRAIAKLASDDTTPMLERDVTDRLLTRGYHFGVLGTIEDEPRVEHVGGHRSTGWRV